MILKIWNSPKNAAKFSHTKPQNKTKKQRERYRLKVYASDRGDPPSTADVDVELDVVDRNNKPPIWDRNIYGPIHIKENVTVGTVVTSIKARLVYSLVGESLSLNSVYVQALLFFARWAVLLLASQPLCVLRSRATKTNASNDRSKESVMCGFIVTRTLALLSLFGWGVVKREKMNGN